MYFLCHTSQFSSSTSTVLLSNSSFHPESKAQNPPASSESNKNHTLPSPTKQSLVPEMCKGVQILFTKCDHCSKLIVLKPCWRSVTSAVPIYNSTGRGPCREIVEVERKSSPCCAILENFTSLRLDDICFQCDERKRKEEGDKEGEKEREKVEEVVIIDVGSQCDEKGRMDIPKTGGKNRDMAVAVAANKRASMSRDERNEAVRRVVENLRKIHSETSEEVGGAKKVIGEEEKAPEIERKKPVVDRTNHQYREIRRSQSWTTAYDGIPVVSGCENKPEKSFAWFPLLLFMILAGLKVYLKIIAQDWKETGIYLKLLLGRWTALLHPRIWETAL
ncbi:hypothetical protein VTL71DRAFT_203 [Oculimacula yallundae]|uniref:Uncharacterized protein n=1 Tax=Oculimacula yallundae TaxID=86028 RepID=A0ABR4CZG4_9HELO